MKKIALLIVMMLIAVTASAKWPPVNSTVPGTNGQCLINSSGNVGAADCGSGGGGNTLIVTDLGTATTLTCTFDNTYFVNLCRQINTAATGTYTIANPTVTTCTQGQRLQLRIKSTNAQTYSFGSEFRGGTDLPLAGLTHAGGSTTDYLGFICNETDTKWDFVAIARGY